jgi:hypothetical protein
VTEKDPAPTQAEATPTITPATAFGQQGGTSQPGPPADPSADAVGEVDFEEAGVGTENSKKKDKSKKKS